MVATSTNDENSLKFEAKEELRRFIESSTIRGLKRTTASNSSSIRLFWSLFILISMAVMSWHIFEVVKNYQSLSDSTIIRTSVVFNATETFPGISVCGVNLMNRTEMNRRLSVTDYSRIIRKMAMDMKRNNYTDEYIMNLLKHETVAGYFAQFDSSSFSEIALDFDDFVIEASLIFYNGTRKLVHSNFNIFDQLLGSNSNASINKVSTNSIISTNFFHQDFALCTSINLKHSTDVSAVLLTLILSPTEYNTSSDLPSGRAARGFPVDGLHTPSSLLLAVHETEVYPASIMMQRGVMLQTGSLNIVRFRSEVTRFLKCESRRLSRGRLGEFDYSRSDCESLKRDAYLRSSAVRCTEDPYAFPTVPACLRIENSSQPQQFIWKFANYSHILQQYFLQQQSSQICQLPSCMDEQFSVSIASSKWAINDFQWYWGVELTMDPSHSIHEYLVNAENESFISNPRYQFSNFSDRIATALVLRENRAQVRNVEVPLTTGFNLLSALGGALSLYVGITLTFVAEMCELVYRLCAAYQRRSRSISSNSNNNNNDNNTASCKPTDTVTSFSC